MTIAVVTSFSPQGYELYGKRMLAEFERFWPKDVWLYVYYEGTLPLDAMPRAHWISLDQDKDRAAFMAAHKDHPTDYNRQPVKFSHKVFAITSAPRKTDWLIWLDGDVDTTAPVTHEFLNSILPDDVVAVYLGRDWWRHTETGFVAYRLGALGEKFLDSLRSIYTSGAIVDFVHRGEPQQHDCAAFDGLREIWEEDGQKFHDLGAAHKGPSLDVMAHSPLAKVMFHNKGARKTAAVSPASRYGQLMVLVQSCKPRKIVEVGTYQGKRAEAMCREALKYNSAVHYLGFDLFEDATDETNVEEMNGKGAGSSEIARQKLEAIKQDHPGFTFDLVKGNTRETLHGKNIVADFVFIDGGHSVETIRGDYEAVKGSRLVAFDDYYTKGVDTAKFGCNAIVDKLPHTVLPAEDWVRGGGRVHIAVVGDYQKPTASAKRRKMTREWEKLFDQQRKLLAKYGDTACSAQTFEMWENDAEDKPADIIFVVNILERLIDYDAALVKIKSLARMAALFAIEIDAMRSMDTWKAIIGRYFRITDVLEQGGRIVISADSNVIVPGVVSIPAGTDEGRWNNIKASVAKYRNFLQGRPKHERRAIIACYGPSLKDYIGKLKEESAECDVVSVSGAHDFLIENGVIPTYHVECDPRPHKSVQVTPQKGIQYLLAASCHPDLFAKMDGMDVRLWHAEDHIRVKDELNSQAPNISGGGSVGLRSIAVLYFMGYRNLTVYGMDCSFTDDGKTQHAGKHAGKIQDLCAVKVGGREFITSPILMTYAANFFDMAKQRPDVKWRVYGDGFLQNWIRFSQEQTEAA
jgi:hypothetical protein